MRAGALRQRITLQAVDPDQWQGQGLPAPGAVSLGTVWAEKTVARDAQRFGASDLESESTATFIVRYRADHARIAQVVYGAVTYQVEAATDPDGRRRELQIECRQVTD